MKLLLVLIAKSKIWTIKKKIEQNAGVLIIKGQTSLQF